MAAVALHVRTLVVMAADGRLGAHLAHHVHCENIISTAVRIIIYTTTCTRSWAPPCPQCGAGRRPLALGIAGS